MDNTDLGIKAVGHLMNEFCVYDVGYTKTRVGKDSDGGYVTLAELNADTKTLYSFGVGDDISFEKDFMARWPEAKGILCDPTIPKLPETHPALTFHKLGFLQELHSGRMKLIGGPAILKMDIEWNEWDGLEVMTDNDLLKFDQLLVEFHVLQIRETKAYSPYFQAVHRSVIGRQNMALFEKYYRVMQRLNKLFYIFHIHPNNSLPKESAWLYNFPPLVEVSFVRKDLVEDATLLTEFMPIPGLDFPNKTDRPDIVDFYPMGR